MKQLTIALIALLTINIYGQTKLSELPALGSIDESEYLYGYRSAISYRISSALFTAMMGDTADVVRAEMVDSFAVLRTEIQSGGAGEYWNVGLGDDGGLSDDTYTLFPTINNPLGSNYMRLMLGSDPSAASNSKMLTVTGTSYLDGTTTITDSLIFGANTSIKEASGEMELMDNTGTYTLTDLLALPTSLSESWTLDLNTYDFSLLNDDSDGIYSNNATNALYLVADLINAQTPAFDLGDSAHTDAIDVDDIWTSQTFYDPKDTAVAVAGMMYSDTDDGNLYYYNGAQWDTLNGGTGQGAGVFTTGSPVANQIPYFTDPTTLTGSARMTYEYNTARFNNTSADTGKYTNNSSTGIGDLIINSSTGIGQKIINSGANYGQYIVSSSGYAQYIETTSSSIGQRIVSSGTSDGSQINTSSSANGVTITHNSDATALTVNNEIDGVGIKIDNDPSATGDPFQIYTNSTKKIWADQNGYLNLGDSLKLDYAIDLETDEQWLGLSAAGYVFGDSIANAGHIFSMNIPGPIQRIRDVKLDTITGYYEMAWYRSETEKVYKTTGRPSQVIPALHASDEIAARHIANNRILIYLLILIIGLLIANQVRLEIKLRKTICKE